jgi:hypothetical protein
MIAHDPILTFQAIDNREFVISVWPTLFERGVQLLYVNGYWTLNLVEIAQCMRKGCRYQRNLSLLL